MGDHISGTPGYNINKYFQNVFNFVTLLTHWTSAAIISLIFLNTLRNMIFQGISFYRFSKLFSADTMLWKSATDHDMKYKNEG
jgi:hypothetical protein